MKPKQPAHEPDTVDFGSGSLGGSGEVDLGPEERNSHGAGTRRF